MSYKSWPIIPRLSTSLKCVGNQSLILSASSLHAKRYNTCIYLKYVNKSLKENINFEENIFVLTVLSYRKIPTGREEVFTPRVFSFL